MGEEAEPEYDRRAGKGPASSQLMIISRKRVKSFLFFLVAFLGTVMVAANVIDVFTGNISHTINAYQEIIHSTFGSNAAVSFMNGIIDIVEGAGPLVLYGCAAALYVPLVFLCLGMWIMFFQTHRGEEPISTSGYMLSRIMLVLRFIAICLLLAACLIVSVAFVVAAGAASSMASILVGVVLLIIMIVIAVLTVMYYVLALHAGKVIHNNARAGIDRGRISTYVPVMTLILAAISAGLMLPMAPDDYLGLAARGSVVAWLFFGSIWLFAYRGTVKK